MATGERKWASSSTRRSGMTVLGKVAVPKPINLPSQKLENHGMDPNAEIVPKGTLSWGSRSGSPASNPWGTSPLYMNTDNGRPSSGGSSTRPSTGCSEKCESTANAGGSNFRPSSASGALLSNQSSGTTLRPHSADTRPGSSQLSRFAETSSENSGSWADAGSGDQLGHLKKEKFSLAAGDFPTLGSEKENPPKNAHPSPQGGEALANTRINSDISNHFRKDNQPYEDGRRPNMERWHEEALPQNPNMPGPPQQFAPWPGAPVGVWYRGPPGAPHYVPPGGPPGAPPYRAAGGLPFGPSNIPPYEPLIGPGGFPIERPYYHPPMPAPPLGNSQTVPHHSAGPRVGHQNNGEMYRPSNPDGHFRPDMLMRPGFFPGPVPYDSYYPLPMGYCGPNDRDILYLGPVGGPGIYDMHQIPNASEHINSQSASGRHGSNKKPPGPEHGVSGHRHNPHEQYKVLLKHHGEDHEWGDGAAANILQFERGYLCRPSHEKDQGAGLNDGEQTVFRGTSNVGGRIRDIHTHGHGGAQFHQRGRVTDEAKSMKGVSDADKNIQDNVPASENVVAPKDSGLLRKIDGLNAKAGGADGTQDTPLISNQDEGKNRSCMMSNAPYISNDSKHYKSHGSGLINAPSSHGAEAGSGSNSSRKFSNSGPQNRTDYHGKGKSNFLETEGQHKFAHSDYFPTAVSSLKSDPVSVRVQSRSNMVAGNQESSYVGKDEVPNSAYVSDPVDVQAQRAMKKEIAMQRTKQLQREEEERIKEQRAKAQAKLEELNRRTKLMESSTEKEPTAEKAKLDVDNTEVAAEKDKTTSPGGEIDGNEEVTHPDQLGGEATVLNPDTIVIGTRILDLQLQIPKDDLRGTVTLPRRSPADQEGGYHKIDARGEPQHIGGKNNAFKSINKVYKERQTFQHDIVASETTVKGEAETLRYANEAGEEVLKNISTLAEPKVHHRTRSDKSGKNKNKLENTSSSIVIPAVAPNISDVTLAPVDSERPQLPYLAEATHGQSPVISRDLTPSTEPSASQLKEEGRIRVNNHSGYQISRKQTKKQQGHMPVDKTHDSDTVVWAPVRQHNKEATEDSSLNMVIEGTVDHSAQSDHVQGNIKNKRAEIARYVPKPVAKELAHQGSSSQSISPSTSMAESAAARVETAVGNKNADQIQNRQDRVPVERQQRVSGEASHRKRQKDNLIDETIASKNVLLSDSPEAREEKKFSDGWNSPDESKTTAYKALDTSVPSFKDDESFTRSKRHYSKGTRNTGTHIYDREHRKGQTGKDVDIEHSQFVNSNSDEQDRTTHNEPRREGGHPTSHWHTRPYNSAADYRRTRAGGDHQNSGRENNRFVKKEPALHGDHFQPQDVKFTITDVDSKKTDSGSKTNSGPQHDRRERKTVLGSYSSNPKPPTQVEQPPSKEHQHEHPHSSSGMRKNDNHNIQNVRGQKFKGDWNLIEQDKRNHNQASGRGRHRHPNSHYEYKPKGQGQPEVGQA